MPLKMRKLINCRVCSKEFDSSQYYVHLREKHTHRNTTVTECYGCLNEFSSPIINPRSTGEQKHYLNCEECREKAKSIGSKQLIHGEYVYGACMERYKIDRGALIRICPIFPCTAEFERCSSHPDLTRIRQCEAAKCKKCFLEPVDTHKGALWHTNRFRAQCDICCLRGGNSKTKQRVKVKELKIELGGKCSRCTNDDLFSLEFNHKDATLKIKQITRSSSSDWIKEMENIELLCSCCHRLHTAETIWTRTKRDEGRNAKNWKLVRALKLRIGKCQICAWTYEDKNTMAYALDFDHVSTENKVKQISLMIQRSRASLLDELTKVRLICRSCHEKVTCLQRGGKKLKEYYTANEIEDLKTSLLDADRMALHQQEVQAMLKKCIAEEIQ